MKIQVISNGKLKNINQTLNKESLQKKEWIKPMLNELKILHSPGTTTDGNFPGPQS